MVTPCERGLSNLQHIPTPLVSTIKIRLLYACTSLPWGCLCMIIDGYNLLCMRIRRIR